jgi:hypothetical protein
MAFVAFLLLGLVFLLVGAWSILGPIFELWLRSL